VGISYLILTEVEALRRCEQIEHDVWGLVDREVLSATHMRAMVHAGGMAAGAFVDDELAGFVFGFISYEGEDEGVAMHSHLLAVLPTFRGRRLGIGLKRFQREWCLERGIERVTWTFDALQLGNARLNLEHLGATGGIYLHDFYGRFGGKLAGSVSTDRMLVSWALRDPAVASLAADRPRLVADPAGTTTVLAWHAGNLPGVPDLEADGSRLLVALPQSFTTMIAAQPALAERWREAVRAVLSHYFSRGYRAVRVVSGRYLLQRFGPTEDNKNENQT
jgi:chorismate synthase